MKKFLVIFILGLVFLPFSAFAQCKSDGFTVVYVNGIFTTESDAKKDLLKLQTKYEDKNQISDVEFILGYNATHLAGGGDLIKSVIQAYNGASLDYDLKTILNQVHGELKTRKILLVGHSQGTFYTNAAYDYLIKNGVQKDSVSVYNVATPADKVAGTGNYLTSSTDKVINEIVRKLIEIGSAKKPLPANIDITLSEKEQNNPYGGHSLSDVYLQGVPDKIIGDMQKQLDNLSTNEEPLQTDGCFIAPSTGLTYNLQNFGFWVGDGIVNGLAFLYNSSISGVQLAYNFGVQLAFNVNQLFAKTTGFFGAALISTPSQIAAVPKAPPPQTADKSIQGLPLDSKNIQGESLDTTSEDRQDQIDQLLERIDLLKRQIADLQATELLKNQKQNKNNKVTDQTQQQNPINRVELTTGQNILTSVIRTGGGGSSSSSRSNPIYLKILISEVQIGGRTDSKEEFVELYNPNDSDVDLTDWYIHRKTKTGSDYSTFTANSLFSGKKIVTKGYFLIARQDYFTNSADIFIDNSLTEDNSLVLKNPSGEISDKVGWGLAQDFETVPTQNSSAGQSIGRKTIQGLPLDEHDTDNNSLDFELNNPTPKVQNKTYIAPLPEEILPPQKILINEIQIDSIIGTGGTDDDWVELYNPNNVDVDISQWSIQRSPATGAISKKNFESGNKILANGYFLIVRSTAKQELLDLADMKSSILQLSPISTVFLVRNQEIIEDGNDLDIVDKVGFSENAFSPETAATITPPEAKSIERKKLGLDTDNNSNDFKISDIPTPKGTFPKTTIQDATDYSMNPSSNLPGAPVYNLLIKWQSPTTNIDFFQIQYKLNDSDWKDWLTQTTQTQEYFQVVYSLFQDNIYYFRTRVQDEDDNLGSWSEEIKVDMTNSVIINEVAYAGTNADFKDQWIELYNTTAQDIDLTGWKIVSGTNRIDSLNLSLQGTIPAKGYFILERNDDNSLSDITANQIFTAPIWQNYLYLRAPNNRYIDEFLTVNRLDENRYSTERVSAYSFGYLDKNWKLNNSKTLNGKDRDASQIYGTPGQQNSVDKMYTYYSSSFIQDTTLKKEFSPYLFYGDVQIFKGITLTVEPGVVIKFYDNWSKLTVSGTLKAIGTDTEKIIFTSFYDDVDGDSNAESGTPDLPYPGSWLSLYFSPDSQNSQLENVNVRYGGAVFGSSPLGWGNAIWVDQSSISLKNSIVEKNKNRGLRLINSNSTIDSVQFLENNITDWLPSSNESKAIYIQGSSPQIKNSYFENNSTGIYIGSFYDQTNNISIPALPLIENNNFVKNAEPIIFGTDSYPSFINNKATENQFNAIIFASDISQNITLKPDLPYLVKNVSIVPENVTLTLEPGVIMAFQSSWAGLQVDGTLKAIGTSNSPITFRPYNSINPGSWLGLRFTKTNKDSELENINISYGGAFYGHPQNQDFTSAIKVDQSIISLKNSVVQKNANNGVWLINSPSFIDSVQFLEHSISTVLIPAKAIYVQGGSPTIKNSKFTNNYYGIYIENILGTPILENNEFEGTIHKTLDIPDDIYYVNPLP